MQNPSPAPNSLMIRIVLLTATLALTSLATAQADQERPNILWLVSEDNSPDWLQLYNPDQGAPMPAIERLAAGGLVFNHAFSNAPVCSTARSTIISGCYGPRLAAHYHRKQQTVPMPEGLRMFPYYLRQAGYYTTNPGKTDYNFHPEAAEQAWDGRGRKASYRDRAEGQPFFHVQNFATTHEGKLHFQDTKAKTVTDPSTIEVFPYHPNTELFRYTYARYLDQHRTVDEEIGKFIARLEADGLMEDTIIFYYGDHGGVLPRGKGYAYESGLRVPLVVYIPEKWQHLAPFDTAQDRPASRGSRIDGFVEFVDLSATVLNLAGAEIPELIDGEPFLGEGVELEELNRRDTAFGYADRFDEKYDLVRTLRKGNFKYMRNYQPFNFDGLQNNFRYKMLAYQEWRELYHAGKLNAAQSQFFEARPAEALYDLASDPHEVVNLAGDPAYSATLIEMRQLLEARVKGMPDLSFFPEPVLLAEGGENPVAFGQLNKQRIGELIDIADLQLLAFEKAEAGIKGALESRDPWARYWGLIVCSAFGKDAASFYDAAKGIASDESEHVLVRTRAAEFLGLNAQADPRPVLMEVLLAEKDPGRANLILNTAVLLQDTKGFTIDAEPLKKTAWAKGPRKGNFALRRMGYLNGQE
jgi:arylsulfatase A-like enzyme